MDKNQTKPKKFRIIFVFFLFLLLIIFACLFVWLSSMLPQYVMGKFGPSSTALSLKDQFIYSVQLLWYENDLKTPLNTLQSPYSFSIALGESAHDVTKRLKAGDIIQNEEAFEIFLIYSGHDTSIQAGDFIIENGMTAIDIANQFQDSTPREISFVILPGWRLEEIAEGLPTSGLEISPQDFIEFINNPNPDDLPTAWMNYENLEGFLFPDTYRISRHATLQELIWNILSHFDSQARMDLENVFLASGLTLEEATIIASIVEREAVIDDEKPLIASVFLNRLSIGMNLESDPTVQYALGYVQDQDSWWKNPLSRNDLAIQSLYNTYLNPGLPPTPICNPGLVALAAVAYPAQTDYYYFRAACDGSGRHNFSKTFEEHLANACPD